MGMWRKEAIGLLLGVALGSAWQVARAAPGTFAPAHHHGRAAK